MIKLSGGILKDCIDKSKVKPIHVEAVETYYVNADPDPVRDHMILPWIRLLD